MTAVSAALADFRAAQDLYAQLAGILDRIAQGRGGDVYRQHLDRKVENGLATFACRDLKISLEKLLAARPYCSACPLCQVAHPGWNHPDCRTCGGRGWTTQAAFEACPESYRQDLLRLSTKAPAQPAP
jgi:hypothetical protein